MRHFTYGAEHAEHNMTIDIIALDPIDDPEQAFDLSRRGGASRIEIHERSATSCRVRELRARGEHVRVFSVSSFRDLVQGVDANAEENIALQAQSMGFT